MRAPLVLFTRGSVSRMSSESKGPPAALKGGTDQSEPFSLIRSQAGAVQHQNQLSQSRTLVCLKHVGPPVQHLCNQTLQHSQMQQQVASGTLVSVQPEQICGKGPPL